MILEMPTLRSTQNQKWTYLEGYFAASSHAVFQDVDKVYMPENVSLPNFTIT